MAVAFDIIRARAKLQGRWFMGAAVLHLTFALMMTFFKSGSFLMAVGFMSFLLPFVERKFPCDLDHMRVPVRYGVAQICIGVLIFYRAFRYSISHPHTKLSVIYLPESSIISYFFLYLVIFLAVFDLNERYMSKNDRLLLPFFIIDIILRYVLVLMQCLIVLQPSSHVIIAYMLCFIIRFWIGSFVLKKAASVFIKDIYANISMI